MPLVVEKSQVGDVMQFKHLYSRYQEVKELIPLGGYQPGNDEVMDTAVRVYPTLMNFLRQDQDEASDLSTSQQQLNQLIEEITHGR